MSVRGAEWIDDVYSRENSPHGEPSSKRGNKRRKVLSCYACRNRKMKCDRVYPVCGRCQKTGRADQCTYDPRLLAATQVHDEVPTHGDTASSISLNNTPDHLHEAAASRTLQHKLRLLERRFELLESSLAAQKRQLNLSQYHNVTVDEPDIEEEMMFRGKGFKTQFHGVTSIMSIIARYRELQVFTRETLTVDHSILRIKEDFKTFRDRRKVLMKERGAVFLGTDEEVFAALPDKNILDIQAALYFQTWETTFRVLHEPSFWKEYNTFWEQQPHNVSQVGFAVALILILAITKCVTPKDDVFIGDTTADRQTASGLIDVCEAWCDRQPRKRLTLLFFQLQCLLLLAKRVNCIKLKQDWIASGDLLRLALATGMHRDPSLLVSGRISEFEKEMKKRLWVTIMELELLSSVENGLQSALTGLYFDSPSPSNLPDDAFSTETQEMPASRPLDHFTTASYLIATLNTIPLRVHLTQLLNDPSSEIRHADVMHYDAQLQSALTTLPRWTGDRARIPSALLQLQLRQFLLILHKPYARLAAKHERFSYSFITIVDAASSIISTHNDLLDQGMLSLNHSRNDVVRVGLTLSGVVYENCARHGPVKSSIPAAHNSSIPNLANTNSHFADMPSAKGMALPDNQLWLATLPQSPFLAKTLCTTSVEILEIARRIYEQKVMRLGTGYMEHWLLCAAVGMLPVAPRSSTSNAHFTNASDELLARCRKSLEYFTTLAFRVLALQRDPENSFASSLRVSMASVSPSEGRTPNFRAGQGIRSSIGHAAMSAASGKAPFPTTPSFDVDMNTGSLAATETETSGTFDALQDMQVDLSGWSFPEFWAFDLDGDF
ncbi:hypothetical protein ACN47E_001083 [Coniothyrium glycines]